MPKDQTSCELDNRYPQDLIDMDGLIVPVGRPPPRTSRRAPPLPAPPSYNDSVDLPAENAAQDFTPQYSYSNRQKLWEHLKFIMKLLKSLEVITYFISYTTNVMNILAESNHKVTGQKENPKLLQILNHIPTDCFLL